MVQMLPVNRMYRKPADICIAIAKERCLLFCVKSYRTVIVREAVSASVLLRTDWGIQSGIWQVIIYWEKRMESPTVMAHFEKGGNRFKSDSSLSLILLKPFWFITEWSHCLITLKWMYVNQSWSRSNWHILHNWSGQNGFFFIGQEHCHFKNNHLLSCHETTYRFLGT